MTYTIFNVEGMSCAHCEKCVNTAVSALAGVSSCKADAKQGTVDVAFDDAATHPDEIIAAIRDAGYEVS